MAGRPPGKRSGLTTNESVLNASLSPEGSVTTAASVWGPGPVAKAARKTASIKAAEALPPAPWARVTTSSNSRGRRRRKASMRSKTASRYPVLRGGGIVGDAVKGLCRYKRGLEACHRHTRVDQQEVAGPGVHQAGVDDLGPAVDQYLGSPVVVDGRDFNYPALI